MLLADKVAAEAVEAIVRLKSDRQLVKAILASAERERDALKAKVAD